MNKLTVQPYISNVEILAEARQHYGQRWRWTPSAARRVIRDNPAWSNYQELLRGCQTPAEVEDLARQALELFRKHYPALSGPFGLQKLGAWQPRYSATAEAGMKPLTVLTGLTDAEIMAEGRRQFGPGFRWSYRNAKSVIRHCP